MMQIRSHLKPRATLVVVLLTSVVALTHGCNVTIEDAGDGDGDAGSPGGDGDGDTGGQGGETPSSGGAASGGMGGSDAGGTETGGAGTGGMATGGAGTGGTDAEDPTFNCDAAQGEVSTLGLSQIAINLTEPIFATSAPGEDEVLYVVEQGGKIKRVVLGGLPTTFLNISAKTDRTMATFERGLLGLAFHPGYAENGLFYVHYTDLDGDSVVEEYERSLDPSLAKPTAVRIVFSQPQPYTNNNGGPLAFHPSDGMLYVALGDGGNAGDPMNNAQTASNLLGSLFPIDVDESTIPKPTSWDIGLRSPARFSFDLCTGDRYIADSGISGDRQEINIASHATSKNWGWKILEGNSCYPNGSCDTAGLEPPAYVFDGITPAGPFNLGGFVYRGSLPELRGMYFFADYTTGKVGALRWTASGGATGVVDFTTQLGTAGKVLGGFGQDGLGELYLIERDPGAIYRIER